MRVIYSIVSFLLVLGFFLSSCSVEKRRYDSGFYIQRPGSSAVHKSRVVQHQEPSLAGVEHLATEELAMLSNDAHTAIELELKQTTCIENSEISTVFIPSPPQSDSLQPCSKLVLNNGNEISAVMIEIGPTDVRYKRCENQGGPYYVLPKSLIFLVQSPNGENEILSPQTSSPSESRAPRTYPWGVIGTLLGTLGLFVAGIPLGLLAIIFSGVSLDKIKREPDKYKGRGWAIAGLIMGGLSVLGALLYILFFL